MAAQSLIGWTGIGINTTPTKTEKDGEKTGGHMLKGTNMNTHDSKTQSLSVYTNQTKNTPPQNTNN